MHLFAEIVTIRRNHYAIKPVYYDNNAMEKAYIESDVADDTGRIVDRLQDIQHTGHCQRVATQLKTIASYAQINLS